MGTYMKRMYMVTDINVNISHQFYIDAEDPNDDQAVYDDARNHVLDTDDVRQKARVENAMAENIIDVARSYWNDLSWSDLDDVQIDVTWNWQDIEVCEWCESPKCDGDPSDCESAPEWCYDCGNPEDECTCDDDDDEPAITITENVDVKQQIEKILAEANEVESIL